MKYIFIINPVAGPENAYERYGKEIERICSDIGVEYELIQTERAGHATEIAISAADSATADNPVRIFSVGGDGTLCEASSGIMNKPYCELGCLPCGSGNDYIKCFGKVGDYLDIASYITSDSVPVDCISAGELRSINICSLGLDAKMCDCANRIKAAHKKLSGPKAYDRAVARCFFGKLYNRLVVTIDDDKVYSGKYLFTIAASGQYYGGGYCAAPLSDPSDGLLDFVLIKTVSHLRVPFLLSSYKSGRFVGDKRFDKLLTYVRGKKIRIQSKKPAILNVDGECLKISDVTIELIPAALRFIVPKAYLAAHSSSL